MDTTGQGALVVLDHDGSLGDGTAQAPRANRPVHANIVRPTSSPDRSFEAGCETVADRIPGEVREPVVAPAEWGNARESAAA